MTLQSENFDTFENVLFWPLNFRIFKLLLHCYSIFKIIIFVLCLFIFCANHQIKLGYHLHIGTMRHKFYQCKRYRYQEHEHQWVKHLAHVLQRQEYTIC